MRALQGHGVPLPSTGTPGTSADIWVKVSSSQLPSLQDFGCFSSWCLQPAMLFVSQQMDLFSRDHPGLAGFVSAACTKSSGTAGGKSLRPKGDWDAMAK